jgi:chromosome partitioning protein
MNQYSQVGKTMTTLNLGYALALMNKRVTLIDTDPKAQLSQDCQLADSLVGLNQVLQDEATMEQAMHSLADGFEIIPAGQGLIASEKATKGDTSMQQSYQLKQKIDAMVRPQDFILIDCPSKPSLLTLNALLAADEIIIPTKVNFVSLQGMVRIISLFKRLKKIASGAKLWLILTHIDQTDKMAVEVKNSLISYFPQRVFDTVIRQDSNLSDSRRYKKAVFDYDQDTDAAADYFSLAQDIIERRVS